MNQRGIDIRDKKKVIYLEGEKKSHVLKCPN